MFRAFAIVSIAATFWAAQPQDEAVQKELKLFQGKWEAVAAQSFDGTKPTDVELQLQSLVVEGDKFTMKTGSITVSGTLVVDPSKKPKTIDIFLGEGKDNPMRGIYEIKGDVRKSCFTEPGKDRPEKFSTDKGFMTLEWRKTP